MASLNKCLFIGNLTADPEIRTMPNGEPVDDNSFISTIDGKSLFVKESKSRILKMIETTK